METPGGTGAVCRPWRDLLPPLPETVALEGRRRKTGNVQGTNFTGLGKEGEKEGRKEKKIKKS